MNERETVAVREADGQSWWFPLNEAQHWTATTMEGGELFRAAGRWILLDAIATLLGGPARIVDDEAALAWLTVNGYMPPAELVECAERRKLR